MTNRNNGSNTDSLNAAAENLSCVCRDTFNCNAMAVTLAQLLCEGKSKAEIAKTYQFLQVLHAAIRSYML